MARLIDANALSKKWQDMLDIKTGEKEEIAVYKIFEILIKRLSLRTNSSTQCTLLARATVGSASTGKNPMTIAKSLRQSAIKVIFAATASAGRIRSENFSSLRRKPGSND